MTGLNIKCPSCLRTDSPAYRDSERWTIRQIDADAIFECPCGCQWQECGERPGAYVSVIRVGR